MLFSVPALLLLIVANSSPVIAAWLLRDGLSAPIDGGTRWSDGRPVCGSHKTWRGLVAGVLASAVLAQALGIGWPVGTAFGALALTGDLASSFAKRRLGLSSGRWTPILDQFPEALLPMVVLRGQLGLDGPAMLGTAILFSMLDLLGSWMTAGRKRSQQAP